MQDKEYLTQEKFDSFTKELEVLKGEKRKEVAEALEYAKALGDLSENAEYHDARDEQANVEDRIAKIESILKSAIIIKEQDSDIVNVGSSLVVEKGGKKIDITIVGTEESDVMSGKISVRSPFGQAVMGRKKGDTFSFEAPNGTMEYKIVEIK
jgi:transcription elongation factor GreA